MNCILRHFVGVWKLSARCMPHQLIEEQRMGMVERCLQILKKINGGRSERFWDIVTGNETIVYQYDQETNQQSSVWLLPGENQTVKFKKPRSTSKQMMAVVFAKFTHVASDPLKGGGGGEAVNAV